MHQIRPVRSCRHRAPESDPRGKEVPERLLAIGIHLLAEKKSGLQKLRSIQNLGYFGRSLLFLQQLHHWLKIIKEAIQSEVENSSEIQTDTAETTDPGTYFYSWDDEQGYKDYSIGAGYGPAQAGVQFEAGKYGVFTSSAEVTLTVTRKKAYNEQYTLKDGEDTLFLTFEEGDTIQVESEESDFDSVYLMEWED